VDELEAALNESPPVQQNATAKMVQTPVCIKESVAIGSFGPNINSLPELSGILKTQSPTDS
jgi:hypothetical protein